MISLNSAIHQNKIYENSYHKYNANSAGKINFTAKDKFVSKLANKRKAVENDLMTILEDEKALDILSKEIDSLSGYRKKVIKYDNGAKTITFRKGLSFLPWSYRGEFNFSKDNKLNSAVIIADKPEFFKGKKCRKNIYINRVQGIQVVYETKSLSAPQAEYHYDLKGNLNKSYEYDRKENYIKKEYSEGSLLKESIKYANIIDIDETIIEYKNGKKDLSTVYFHPNRFDAVRKKVYNDKNTLIQEGLIGIRNKDKITNILVDYINGERIITKDVMKGKIHDYSIRKGDIVLKYKFDENNPFSFCAEVPVPIYHNNEIVGERTIPLHLVKYIL